ncbi:MAG: FAD-dependent oxidoreductase [Alphaproteobacteria bacterium]|nr:FAD-dependent oxidoreductase [Alphaproteobacteria bacterium]
MGKVTFDGTCRPAHHEAGKPDGDNGMALDHVFSPLSIKGVEIKNRVLRTAHGTNLGCGSLSDDLIAYHEARARGGVGLSLLEASSVHWSGPMTMHAWDDSVIPRYRELMKAVRPHGMRMFSQINHMGFLQGAVWSQPWSASEIVVNPASGMTSRAMTTGDIAEIVDAFAQAARRAAEGGLDGVEVHAAHNFLIQQFISPATNRRTDAYGGSFENRIRFFLEVLRAVRQAVGPDYVAGVRVGPHNFPGGLNVDEHRQIVERVLQEDGLVDFIDVSHGSSGVASHKIIGGMHEDTGYELHMSVPVTRAVARRVPTFVTGRFRTLDDVDRAIARGDADMVGMTRAHIADPDIVRKTLEGRAHEIRPCIGCNQGCLGGLAQGRIGCTVNPAAGQETTLNEDLMQPAATAIDVLVVGGGPAGMEAARVAALRGHRVILAEAGPRLGGAVQAARLAPRHGGIGDIVDWLEDEMDRRGVRVLLNTRVDRRFVEEAAPDAVILATGSTPRMDGRQREVPDLEVDGVGRDGVVSSLQLLAGRHNQVGGTALVLDDVGSYEAIGAAEFLVEKGAAVTFATSHASLAPQMERALVVKPALERLTAKGRFTLLTRACLKSVGENQAVVGSLDGWPDAAVPAETVVLVTANRPEDGLAGELAAQGIPVHVVGDALAGEFLPHAIRSAHLAARSL